MTVLAVYLLNTAQKNAAMAINGTPEANGQGVNAQEINNWMADTLGYGVIVGMFMLPARILNDPDMQAWRPLLEVLTPVIVDTETLFLPEPEV